MGSGASSATPCLAGFFALRCFSLITIWVTPESWAVKLITSLPHWFYTRILRVPKCFPAVGPSLDANSLHNSGGIDLPFSKVWLVFVFSYPWFSLVLGLGLVIVFGWAAWRLARGSRP